MHTCFEIMTEHGWEPCNGYLQPDNYALGFWSPDRFIGRGWPKDATPDSQDMFEQWEECGGHEYPTYATLPEVMAAILEHHNAGSQQIDLKYEDGGSDKSRQNNHTAGSEPTAVPVPAFKTGDMRVLIFFD